MGRVVAKAARAIRQSVAMADEEEDGVDPFDDSSEAVELFREAHALQEVAPEEALALYKRAADLGEYRAMANMGAMFERAGDVPRLRAVTEKP